MDPSYCGEDVVQSLEKTQLKLIYIFEFLAKTSAQLPKEDMKAVNGMIKQWREKQMKHVTEKCNETKYTDAKAKFVALKC